MTDMPTEEPVGTEKPDIEPPEAEEPAAEYTKDKHYKR
jgi:hypothetical protein